MNQNIKVYLIDYTNKPHNVSIGSARTCYSSRGIVYPSEVEKNISLRDKIAKSTLKAGHLTTRQHSQFIFAIEGVSRQFVWSFLHSHPYYNSEQVSQRYVEVKKGNYYIPSLNFEENKCYQKVLEFSEFLYFKWIEKLKFILEENYFSTFPNKKKHKEKYQNDIHKKCLELARYFLPTATTTYLYHTINGLTLHRYYKSMNQLGTMEEQKIVVHKMIKLVREIDPDFVDEIAVPLEEEEFLDFQVLKQAESKKKLESYLGEDYSIYNPSSQLIDHSTSLKSNLANAIRTCLGDVLLDDDHLIDLVLNPKNNKQIASTLNESTLSPLMRCLQLVHFTFKKKISHTADSQNQRHRTIFGTRPLLHTQYKMEPDFIIPKIIRENEDLKKIFVDDMHKLFEKINHFYKITKNPVLVSYLLPNAFPIRYYESGNLLNYLHRWKTRLCYNAQEEILDTSIQEVSSIEKIFPFISKYIKAPCWYRYESGVKPFCPEGDKFCGVKVWLKGISEY